MNETRTEEMNETRYFVTVRWSSGEWDTFPLTKESHDYLIKEYTLDCAGNTFRITTSDGGRLLLKLKDAVAVRLVTVAPDEEYVEAEIT